MFRANHRGNLFAIFIEFFRETFQGAARIIIASSINDVYRLLGRENTIPLNFDILKRCDEKSNLPLMLMHNNVHCLLSYPGS